MRYVTILLLISGCSGGGFDGFGSSFDGGAATSESRGRTVAVQSVDGGPETEPQARDGGVGAAWSNCMELGYLRYQEDAAVCDLVCENQVDVTEENPEGKVCSTGCQGGTVQVFQDQDACAAREGALWLSLACSEGDLPTEQLGERFPDGFSGLKARCCCE